MTKSNAGEHDFDEQIKSFPESTENSIFKKSEHEEIMEELGELKRRIKDLQTYPPPYIPCVPYVPPYDPCRHCCPQRGCGNCPYYDVYPSAGGTAPVPLDVSVIT